MRLTQLVCQLLQVPEQEGLRRAVLRAEGTPAVQARTLLAAALCIVVGRRVIASRHLHFVGGRRRAVDAHRCQLHLPFAACSPVPQLSYCARTISQQKKKVLPGCWSDDLGSLPGAKMSQGSLFSGKMTKNVLSRRGVVIAAGVD